MYFRTARTLLVFIAISVMSMTLSGQQIHTKYAVKVGQPHFDFLLPNIETGELTKLSEFRGKKVLLLHFASW